MRVPVLCLLALAFTAPVTAQAEPARCPDAMAALDDALAAVDENAVLEVLEGHGELVMEQGFVDHDMPGGDRVEARQVKAAWGDLTVVIHLVTVPDGGPYYDRDGQCGYTDARTQFGKGPRGIDIAVLDGEWVPDPTRSDALLDLILGAALPTSVE